QRRQRALDPMHLGDAAVFDRDVEIGAHKDALAVDIELFHVEDHFYPVKARRGKYASGLYLIRYRGYNPFSTNAWTRDAFPLAAPADGAKRSAGAATARDHGSRSRRQPARSGRALSAHSFFRAELGNHLL